MGLTGSRKRLLRRIQTRRGREAEGVVLLEGERAISTARAHGAEFLFVVQAQRETDTRESRESGVQDDFGEVENPVMETVERVGSRLRRDLEQDQIEFVGVPATDLREFTDTETSQGILAIAREPRLPLPQDLAARGRHRCLVLDGVQDPGNVGALIRVAAAFEVDRVLALDGTADPWSAKAVRGSAGLAFALPVHTASWEEARGWLRDRRIPILGADRGGSDVRKWVAGCVADGTGSHTWALALGNEGRGLRPDVREQARTLLSVPIAAAVESLNVAVAGSLLLWILGPGSEPVPGRSGESSANVDLDPVDRS